MSEELDKKIGKVKIDTSKYRFDSKDSFDLKKFDTSDTGGLKGKKTGKILLERNVQTLAELQARFYAQDTDSLLMIFQAMDSAGKDGAIKHVMSGVNPQGVDVSSFKKPSAEDLDHDYLWRINKHLPERGHIGIFNRSYYEDVLVAKVHNLPESQALPERCKTKDIWERRYEHLRNYEKYLYENGFTVIKFFLNISKEEQRKRFLARIDDESKNWKFSDADIKERSYWDDYMKAYSSAVNATSSKHAPWYVIPADKKWFARLLVSQIVIEHLEKINPQFPVVSEETKSKLEDCRIKLEND